ncbi:MAG: tetratricopeptide repeat protein [Verrucomicrobia bacterium]|nr:tetratricopeptide repeat protein [Verrucomicrobiota bacterium]MDA1005171.1 tetratricopeptide repeat protein [Verrucomicrobiota bacterium]
MKTPRFLQRFLGGVLLLSVLLTAAPVRGQGSIDEYWSNSLTAMNNEEWAKAHGYLEKAVNAYGARAMTLFGPKFGWFYYHKGYCELKLQKYAEAKKSFEDCYKKFPNGEAAKPGTTDNNISFNLYHKKALLKWGEAAQGAEEYEEAIRMYNKFIAERDPTRDKYERGAFYINMAICHFKLFKIPQGIENLETAIKNKETFPTPDEGIMAGFQTMVQAVIEKKDEQAFMDFLRKNRADITLEPFQMHKFATVFMKLAADALEADMDRSVWELYALVPSNIASIEDVQARKETLGNLTRPIKDGSKILDPKGLAEDLEALKAAQRSGNPHEVVALAATAYIHEQNRNVRGAFAAYEQLELYYDKSKKREDYLYNLVRTSSVIGEVLTTEKYGSRFLKAFPGSKYEESVRSMMLTSLFFEGEYAKCIEVATIMIDKLPKPSKQHDICLHVLGGSKYYTGVYDEAQPLLDQHVEEYPKSDFKMAALYFQGSNLSRLQYWSKAASLLDAFLTKYPSARENIYLPFALFDRANCHYAEDEMDPALEKLNRLEKEFPTTEIMDMAYNLKGNVLQTLLNFDEAEKYYLKALELAERRENRIVSGESLYYLVGILGAEKRDKEENPRVKDAVPYYDKFWKEYGSESPYKAQVAVAGVHALTTVGRADEALERLQGVISELAQIQGAFGLEEAINSYTKAYLKEKSADELKDHYYKFPGIDAENKAAQALLRIAIIGVFEEATKMASREKDEALKLKADATIKVLFEDLKNDFQPKTLTNYILVRVGDYLREKTAAPRLALPYYEEVAGREDQSYRFPALFGIADVLGSSDNSAENDKAIASLERIAADAPEREEKEKALYRICTILAQKGDWSKCTERCKEYLDREKNYRKFGSFVSFLLAQSYDERGMSEDALRAYNNVYAAYAGHILVSAPAVKRVMEITWKRGNTAAPPEKSDQQVAYEFGWGYIDSTRRIVLQMTKEEKALWEAVEVLVQQYEDDPGTKKMEDIIKEKKASR